MGKSPPLRRTLRLQNKLHPAAVAAAAAGPSEKALGHATQGIEMPEPGKRDFANFFSPKIALFQI